MPNPRFMAFQKLKKHIADKLGIPNSVKAAKIGGDILKKIKSIYPDMDSVNAATEAIKEFDNNIDKYKINNININQKGQLMFQNSIQVDKSNDIEDEYIIKIAKLQRTDI